LWAVCVCVCVRTCVRVCVCVCACSGGSLLRESVRLGTCRAMSIAVRPSTSRRQRWVGAMAPSTTSRHSHFQASAATVIVQSI
jgi:hypothetical protein